MLRAGEWLAFVKPSVQISRTHWTLKEVAAPFYKWAYPVMQGVNDTGLYGTVEREAPRLPKCPE